MKSDTYFQTEAVFNTGGDTLGASQPVLSQIPKLPKYCQSLVLYSFNSSKIKMNTISISALLPMSHFPFDIDLYKIVAKKKIFGLYLKKLIYDIGTFILLQKSMSLLLTV